MADIEKKTKRYPSDLTDEEWERMFSTEKARAKMGRAYPHIQRVIIPVQRN
jgi:hypothetical protein